MRIHLAGYLGIAVFIAMMTPQGLRAQGSSEDRSNQRRFLAQLDNQNWEARETATAELMSADPSLLPDLVSYASSDISFDTRMRLRKICQELYRTQRLGPSRAFLGIQNQPLSWTTALALPTVQHPIPVGHHVLVVSNVIDGTAAEEAGLMRGDMLVAIDGERALLNDSDAQRLTDLIGKKRPEALCNFTVVRDTVQLVLDIGSRATLTPQYFAGMKVKPITAQEYPILAPNTCGLRVEDLGDIEPSLGIQVGDVIATVDRMPFEPRTAQVQWDSWTNGVFDVDAAVAVWNQSVPPLPPIGIMQKKTTCMTVLRGGQLLEVRARLGRWPRHLLRDDQNRANRNAIERDKEIRAAFDAWWQERVPPIGGGTDDSVRASLYWRMELDEE